MKSHPAHAAFLLPLIMAMTASGVSAGDTRSLKLSVTGTKVEFNEAGLPARMEGVVFYRGGAHDGRFAGLYEETLTPVIDPTHGLVGTKGVSVFRFIDKVHKSGPLGELTTENESFIVGKDADGSLSVETGGKIVGGSRRFENVRGGFASASKVVLQGDFHLDVSMTFSLSHDPFPPVHVEPTSGDNCIQTADYQTGVACSGGSPAPTCVDTPCPSVAASSSAAPANYAGVNQCGGYVQQYEGATCGSASNCGGFLKSLFRCN